MAMAPSTRASVKCRCISRSAKCSGLPATYLSLIPRRRDCAIELGRRDAACKSRHGAADASRKGFAMSLDLLLTIVSRTPLWAWAVLAALILIGVSQSRDRTMGSTRLLLLPLVVGALAISALVATGGSVAALLGLAIGAVAGGALALRIVRRDGAAQVARGTVRVKGEWLTLTILLGAFLTRYVAIVVAE